MKLDKYLGQGSPGSTAHLNPEEYVIGRSFSQKIFQYHFFSTGMSQMSDKVSGSEPWNSAICPNVRTTEISELCRDIVLIDPLSSRHDSQGAPAVAARAGKPEANLYPYYTFLNRGSLQSKVAILGRKQWGFRCHLIISCFHSLTTFSLICCDTTRKIVYLNTVNN